MTRVVRGIVAVPAGDRPSGPVDVVIRIEDVSRADAAAEVLASHRFATTLPSEGEVELPFEIAVEPEQIEERRSYAIRAHVDVTGSGMVESGDYLTTQSYPVLTHGAADRVRLGVRRL